MKRNHFLQYAKIVDPEQRVFRAAILVALSCLLSILIFQWLGQKTLLGWAAFAALAFSQIDTLDLPSRRIPYLLINILIFSLLALIGITLGHHPLWFLISVPVVIFACGATIAWGVRYFNAGAWAAFLYVAFGSSLGTAYYALHVALTFLMVGLLCLIVSLLFFRERPEARLYKSVLQILQKYPSDFKAVEQWLGLQNQLLQTDLTPIHFNEKECEAYRWIHKSSTQLLLMFKNLKALHGRVKQHARFSETDLSNGSESTQALLINLINLLQGKAHHLLDLSKLPDHYREQIQAVQKIELQQTKPDLLSILDYSTYLYHLIQIWQVLASLAEPLKIISRRQP